MLELPVLIVGIVMQKFAPYSGVLNVIGAFFAGLLGCYRVKIADVRTLLAEHREYSNALFVKELRKRGIDVVPEQEANSMMQGSTPETPAATAPEVLTGREENGSAIVSAGARTTVSTGVTEGMAVGSACGLAETITTTSTHTRPSVIPFTPVSSRTESSNVSVVAAADGAVSNPEVVGAGGEVVADVPQNSSRDDIFF